MSVKLFQVIKKINPDANYSYKENDIDTIKWLNGTPPISKSDIETQIPIVEKEIADAATKKATDKASADAKLKALGLTDDEIEAFRN